MTESVPTPSRWAQIARREWYVVLVAALVGAVVAYGFADKSVETSVVAVQRVTAPGTIGSIITPRAEAIVVASSVPSVLRAAEASAGLQPGSLRGRAGAKIDPADKTSALVQVRAASEQEAKAQLAAFQAAIQTYIFRPQQTYMNTQKQAAEQLQQRAAELDDRVVELRAAAAKVPAADRAAYEQAIQSVAAQKWSALDQARLAEQNYLTVRNSVIVDPYVQASKRSTGGMQASTLLQGLLIGLAVGVAVAWIREWLLTRRGARTA